MAVDCKLDEFMKSSGLDWAPYCSRAIPLPILQALLDAFTAVQHWRESTFIRIRSQLGLATVVV